MVYWSYEKAKYGIHHRYKTQIVFLKNWNFASWVQLVDFRMKHITKVKIQNLHIGREELNFSRSFEW